MNHFCIFVMRDQSPASFDR